MTQIEKKQFVRDLVGSVQTELLSKLTKVPDDWDGHELRQWIANEFARQTWTLKQKPRRLRAYRNAVLANNL